MLEYTILPLAKLLDSGRPHVKLGDLRQIEEKIRRQRAKKLANPAQQHATTVEDNYLRVLARVTEGMTAGQKIPIADLRARVDQVLEGMRFTYSSVKHPPAAHSRFYGPGETDEVFDVAFYNVAAPYSPHSHHRLQNMSSIFYARLEVRGDEVLIGNLQIDPRVHNDWTDPELPPTLLQTKNLYRALVQEALKFALKEGKRKILFQAGAAMELAQGFSEAERVKKLTLTEDNYPHYQKLYDEFQAKYAAATVGMNSVHYNEYWRYPGIIIEKTEEYYKCAYSHVGAGGANLAEILVSVYEEPKSIAYSRVRRERLHEFEVATLKHYLANDLEAFVQECDAAFKVFVPSYVAGPTTEKLAYLRATRAAAAATVPAEHLADTFEGVRDKFLIKFNFHKQILAELPTVQAIQLAPAAAARYPGSTWRFYVPEISKKNVEVFQRADMLVPEIGKTYLVPKEMEHLPLSAYYMRERNNFYWYDRRLPELLTHQGLTIKKVPISRTIFSEKNSAEAWEVIDGLEEFATRPLVSFAQGAHYKTDIEVLPRLQRAAQKFGLAPNKLRILNNWLVRPEGSFLGAYTAPADAITLTTGSLALLAHEGLHRLLKKGLIPAAEYQALVSAGRTLVDNEPALAARLAHVPGGPPGTAQALARADEYAALFVEKYYENNTPARQRLMSQPLPIFQKVIDYLVEVWDILRAHCGHCPAVAKSFLRQVERRELNLHYQKRKRLPSRRPVKSLSARRAARAR